MTDSANQSASTAFAFDNTYARELDGFYASVQAEPASAPRLLRVNHALATELGLDEAALSGAEAAQVFSGNLVPHGAHPIALAYAGHQFGGFSPQLGDGRALLLGELIDADGQRRDLQLKGSGRTPFSRRGDGRAALGPVLREYLIGEAMHALGIPTTRALAAVSTGDPVFRETTLPGAVLARVAASHIRVGTFQYFASRGENSKVQLLADYVIRRHYPQAAEAENRYLKLLEIVRDRQAALVAQWMQVGFIHGVMNTDNMTISGETIDYGPCAFMDRYDPKTVYSSIDMQGRYAYANQPVAAQWNLARLAETLLPLIDEDSDKAVELATEQLEAFPEVYDAHWLTGMAAKFGLAEQSAQGKSLIDDFLALAERERVDYTQSMRRLVEAAEGNTSPLEDLFGAAPMAQWISRWQALARPDQQSAQLMRALNPLYIPRNHLVEQALGAAVDQHDFTAFDQLLKVVSRPYDWQPGQEVYEEPAPLDSAPYQTFCGT